MAQRLDVENGGNPPKIPKLSPKEESENKDNAFESFENFVLDRVLRDDARRKTVFLEGHFKEMDDKAVVILEKIPFSKESLEGILTSETDVKIDIDNYIYKSLHIYPPTEFNGIKSTVVYPATEKHILKYSAQEIYLVNESVETYRNITLPYIEASQFNIQWVYNILEKKSEADQIVVEDTDLETGFIMVPDMKWTGQQIEDLYLVAIVHKRNIKSLRDLDETHLPLLQNILIKGQAAIEERYGVKKHQLRIYLHYQPSYYHLHVHFTHIKFEARGSGVEKAHLLDDVIDNIKMMPDFYQKKTLSFMLKESDQLLVKYREAGLVSL